MADETESAFPASIDNWRKHPHSSWGFQNVDRLVPTRTIEAGAAGAKALRVETLDLEAHQLADGRSIRTALNESFTDGFLVLHRGNVVAEHYANGLTSHTRHIVFSVSKSITGLVAGVLVDKGLLDPEALAVAYVPELAGSAFADATVRQVLDMTVNVRFIEDYLDPLGDVARYRVAMDWDPPRAFVYEGGLHDFLARLPRNEGPHGHMFQYVSPTTDVLGWVLERAGGKPLGTLVSECVWQPMGAESDAFIAVDRHGAARAAGGICATLGDLGRLGEMMRNEGSAEGRQVVPAAWFDDILNGGSREAWGRGEFTGLFSSARYRAKWYVPDVVPGEFCAIGIHGQWIYVDPVAEMTVVKLSSQPIPADDAMDQQTLAVFRMLGQHYRARA